MQLVLNAKCQQKLLLRQLLDKSHAKKCGKHCTPFASTRYIIKNLVQNWFCWHLKQGILYHTSYPGQLYQEALQRTESKFTSIRLIDFENVSITISIQYFCKGSSVKSERVQSLDDSEILLSMPIHSVSQTYNALTTSSLVFLLWLTFSVLGAADIPA